MFLIFAVICTLGWHFMWYVGPRIEAHVEATAKTTYQIQDKIGDMYNSNLPKQLLTSQLHMSIL